jgi:hypothetical protein
LFFLMKLNRSFDEMYTPVLCAYFWTRETTAKEMVATF